MQDHQRRANISNMAYAVYCVEKYEMGIFCPVVLLDLGSAYGCE